MGHLGLALALLLFQGGIVSLAALPLRSVTLLTSGVGEFVHRGTVSGSGTITFTVAREEMSDFLRSLTLIDHDGGTLDLAEYPTGSDQELQDVHRLADLLRQLRGTPLEVVLRRDEPGEAAPAPVEGLLIGSHMTDSNDGTILIARDRTFREIPLSRVELLRCTDPAMQESLDAALAALTRTALEKDLREVSLNYSGRGRRTLEIRYLREMPLWNTTYRIVLDPGNRRGLLQGWAHIDNTTDLDWDEVELTLTAANPRTYRFDLYRPRYINRPLFGAPDEPLLSRTARSADRLAFAAAPPEMSREELLTGMTFTLPGPVTIPRGRSMMVPIVNTRVAAEPIRQVSPDQNHRRPEAAVRFTNESSDLLPPGPLTVYEGQRYVGDGAIPLLPARGEAIVTYALDPHLEVLSRSGSPEEELSTLSLAEGILIAERRARLRTTYEVRSLGVDAGGPDTPIVVSHRRRKGWEVIAPADHTLQGEVALVPLRGSSVTVVEEQIREQRYALTDLDQEMLGYFSSNRLIDPTVRRTLQNISSLRSSLEEHRRTRQVQEARREEIFADQQRISTNMAQLERNTSLYREYTRSLTHQEEELRRLRDTLQEARQGEARARDALRDYLQTLGADL